MAVVRKPMTTFRKSMAIIRKPIATVRKPMASGYIRKPTVTGITV